MQVYENILKYLSSFTNYELSGFDPTVKEFDLGKLKSILEKLGSPHRKFKSIHIAGTKGKGSVCSFVSSILTEAGLRVGLFTSPHLETVRERIKIGDEIISKEDFALAIHSLSEFLGSPEEDKFTPLEANLARGKTPNGAKPLTGFTFFEVLTLAAIVYFREKEVDYAVFEVGMGGRFDATNIIDAQICGISPISYDHMNALGNTIEEITREKAAIIKKGAYCVSSPQTEKALGIIKDKCLEEEAPLTLVGEDITCDSLRLDEKGSRFNVRGKKGLYEDCRVNMPGSFQPFNCATAIGICEKLFADKSISEETIKKGLEKTFIPGRLEILSRDPLLVIDGAQNEESALRLKESVEKIFNYKKLILILGLSKDKDIEGVCRQLVPLADEVVLTKASSRRAADPLIVRGYIKGKPARVTHDTKEALGAALGKAEKGDMILATGSFYIIGEVRRLLIDPGSA